MILLYAAFYIIYTYVACLFGPEQEYSRKKEELKAGKSRARQREREKSQYKRKEEEDLKIKCIHLFHLCVTCEVSQLYKLRPECSTV